MGLGRYAGLVKTPSSNVHIRMASEKRKKGENILFPDPIWALRDYLINASRLIDQLMKKLKAYETLLLDLAPELDIAKQTAVQRGLRLVSSFGSIAMAVADPNRSPPCSTVSRNLPTQRPELVKTAVGPVKIMNLQLLVLAQWVQQVTSITMISSRQH